MISRTKILTLIVFGLLFLNLSAQEDFENDPVAKLPDEDRTFRFGLHFSPNLSWFKTNTSGYSSGGSKMGFSYGLSFEYFLSNNYLISSGISILNTGGNLKYSYQGIAFGSSTDFYADVQTDYNLKYIDIPLSLKLRTNEIGYFTYYAQFGLKTGFNFSANSKSSVSYEETLNGIKVNDVNIDDDAKSDINFMNMYMVIGAGVEYNISGNTSLIFGVTFNNGFINQMDTKELAVDDSGDVMFNENGALVYSEKDVNANLNYLALNIGIYF